MIAEAMQFLEDLHKRSSKNELLHTVSRNYRGQPNSYTHKVTPCQYGVTLGDTIQPFRPAKLEVSTLTGFVDALKLGSIAEKEKSVIHIEDHLTVSVKTTACDEFGVRDTLLVARYAPINAFQYDSFYPDPQVFIIKFQVAFHINDPDGAYLLKLASNLTASSSVNTADDGFNQNVTIKAGEVKTLEHTLKPRVKLLPRTTFDEVSPVEREFLIRLKQTPDQTPTIAIFAVDGTKWQGENMRAIKDYLTKELEGWSILA